jgi:hypothetical protein
LQIRQTVEEWSWPPSFATEISASSMRSSFEKLLVDIQDIGRGNLASSARLSRRRSIENAKAAGSPAASAVSGEMELLAMRPSW